MQASVIEFRFRMLIMTTLVVLGYWAPWIEALDLGRRISLLEWLALHLRRAGLLPFGYATAAVIVIGSLFAAVGMVLRIWGAAYLGYGTVHHGRMQAGALMADGPYRYLRNPLYVGGWFMFMAMAFRLAAADGVSPAPDSGRGSVSRERAGRVVQRICASRASARPVLAQQPEQRRQQAALGHGDPYRSQSHRHLHHHGVFIVDLRRGVDAQGNPSQLWRLARGAGGDAAQQVESGTSLIPNGSTISAANFDRDPGDPGA